MWARVVGIAVGIELMGIATGVYRHLIDHYRRRT